MKNLLGNTFKFLILCLTALNFLALQGDCYQTALIVYPEYSKNWKQIYYAKKNNEAISQWIPSYEYNDSWNESVVFHSYNYAKGNSCYKFMLNLMNNVAARNKTIKKQILKDNFEDSVAIWCVDKTSAMAAQCEIIRVTSGYEGLISIHYINKNKQDFAYKQDSWLKVVRDVRIYYSYFRWDRVLGKETSVEL